MQQPALLAACALVVMAALLGRAVYPELRGPGFTLCTSAVLAAMGLHWVHSSFYGAPAENKTKGVTNDLDPGGPTSAWDEQEGDDDSKALRGSKTLRQYTNQMNEFAQKGDLQGATRWMNHIRRRGLTPDRAVFTTMIHACAEASRQDEAARWFAKLEAAGHEADVVAYTAMVRRLRMSGRTSPVPSGIASRSATRSCEPVRNVAIQWEPMPGFVEWNKTASSRQCKPGRLC